MVDVMSEQVSATFVSIPTALSLVRDGRLKALAVTSRERSALVPEVLTVADSGLAGFESIGWHGLWAPARTPREVLTKLQSTVSQIVQMAEVRRLLAAQGLEPVGSTPDQFAEYIRSEYARHARLIRDAGLKFD